MTKAHDMTTDDLIGHWVLQRVEGCDLRFPSELEFREMGVYAAPTGPDEGAIWHGGEWQGSEAGTLAIMAANDAMQNYEIALLTRDRLTLVDQGGCTVRYLRKQA